MSDQKKIMSCCGCVCSECSYYPEDCAGCPAIEGKVFWLEYTGEAVCDIYECVRQKGFAHCGKCGELPCSRYEREDPTKSQDENARDHQQRLDQLRRMKETRS